MANTRLPPVSPRGSGAHWQSQRDPSVSHPFDTPYGIMKGFQNDLANLQAKLEAEQQTRAAEVHSLKEECRSLREALNKERSERLRQCESLDMKVTSEIARHDKTLKHFDDQTTAALRARTLCEDFQELNNRVKALRAEFLSEVDQRNEVCHSLDNRIEANTKGDNDFAQKMRKEMDSMTQRLEKNTAGDQEFAGWVEPRVLMAGRLLQAGCHPPMFPPKFNLSDKAKAGLIGTSGSIGQTLAAGGQLSA